MKSFMVDMDVTMSVSMWVRADNAGEANTIALESIKREPHFYLQKSAFVNAVVVDNLEETNSYE